MIDDQNRLSSIPKELLIQVLHVDISICVIVKPANLRSVPGHANPPPTNQTAADSTSGSSKESSRNAQTCWITAVKSFNNDSIPPLPLQSTAKNDDEWETQIVLESLSRVANTKTVDSVPRKWKSFLRHVHRYQKLIISSNFYKLSNNNNNNTLETLARDMFRHIQDRYRPLLQLPVPTALEDSAMGQLILMGYGSKDSGVGPSASANTPRLYAVHRLDCETSGIMVFARNERAASFLSHAWRREGGEVVTKIYWAKVREWPPFQRDHQMEGRIDLPLASSSTERIKWQVQVKGGKPSSTLWKVLSQSNQTSTTPRTNNNAELSTHLSTRNGCDDAEASSSCSDILLELTPLTGRTHQLRIHCAHVGSGIVGDSLYGSNPVDWTSSGNNQLCLHAYQLQFPHPDTGEPVQFTSPPAWQQS